MTDIGAFPDEVRQAGHVVADLDAAMHEWLELGVGPWTVIDVEQRAAFQGVESEVQTSIGFAHSGALQIELIEAHDDAVSSWHQARDTGRFGLHHLAYWTEDFDDAMARLERMPVRMVQAGDGNGMARFVYVTSPASATLIEIMELTGLSRSFMEGIRAESEHWDGSGPGVRR